MLVAQVLVVVCSTAHKARTKQTTFAWIQDCVSPRLAGMLVSCTSMAVPINLAKLMVVPNFALFVSNILSLRSILG